MLTFTEIRSDLKDIKYYYSRKALFDKAFNTAGKNDVIAKVDKYNEVMKSASPRIFDLYYSLYINNHTQESYSDELGWTPEYVQRLNKQLLRFLQNALKEEKEVC